MAQQVADLQRDIAGITSSGNRLRTAEDTLQRLRNKLDEPLTFAIKRQLVEALVESIRVDTLGSKEGGDRVARLRIRYRFDDTKEIAQVIAHRGTG